MSAAYAQRFEAKLLCTHPQHQNLPYAAVAKLIKKSKAFLETTIQRFRLRKTVDDLLAQEKKSTITKRGDKFIVQMSQYTSFLKLREAKASLAKKGINISNNTIRQR